ncbi:MAG: DUF6505 family protein [Rubrimonas sp.]|uniref:DUF6505 family protein n=1 Tax=Rubrimonas sp. TaxID=2036015 RepID=UPI002FDD10E3
MKAPRAIRFDESDLNVFEVAAEPGELAVSGAFAFSDIAPEQLGGKTRQAFANGWLGLESFGRTTFVAVANVTQAELDQAAMRLAAHFVAEWGAPSLEAALPAARDELAYAVELCEGRRPNTLLIVERSLETEGVREAFRAIETSEADLADVIGPEAVAHAKDVLGLD